MTHKDIAQASNMIYLDSSNDDERAAFDDNRVIHCIFQIYGNYNMTARHGDTELFSITILLIINHRDIL